MSIRVDSAVNTIANPEIVRCNTQCHIFTFVDSTSLIDSRNENGTVDTVSDLHELHIGINVDIGVFTANDSHIFVLYLLVSDSYTLIETVHVDDFIF